MSEWIVVARQTVMDGLCLDWYRSKAAHDVLAWAISVSRDGVFIGRDVSLHTIPEDKLASADSAFRLLATRLETNRELAMTVATHRSMGLRGELEPILAGGA